MDKKVWDAVQKCLRQAKEQDKLAEEAKANGEPSFNLHSVQAEKLRLRASHIRLQWEKQNRKKP
jgi:hypothetical protein